MPPTRAVWIPPQVEHDVTLIGEVALRTVYIDASVAPRALSTCDVIDVTGLLRELVETLATILPNESPCATTCGAPAAGRSTCGADLVARSAAAFRSTAAHLVRSAVGGPGEIAGLEEWAGRVGASPRTLARLFQDELGMTFGQWRQRVRLAHAAALISLGTPLAEVAVSLGYESASAFSAMFKRALGHSPSAFFAAEAK